MMRAVGEERGGKSPAQVAINWCLSKDTTPIPGAKNTRQLEDNLGALGWRLSEGEVRALDDAAVAAAEETLTLRLAAAAAVQAEDAMDEWDARIIA